MEIKDGNSQVESIDKNILIKKKKNIDTCKTQTKIDCIFTEVPYSVAGFSGKTPHAVNGLEQGGILPSYPPSRIYIASPELNTYLLMNVTEVQFMNAFEDLKTSMLKAKQDVYFKKAILDAENGNEESALNWLKLSLEIGKSQEALKL